MSLFDVIKYPISDRIEAKEISRIPMPILREIEVELQKTDMQLYGEELAVLIRRVIRDHDDPRYSERYCIKN